jgi:hypothetical protein
MRSLLVVLLIFWLLPQDAGAQAKSRGCFTKAEQTAEQIVRQGLRLREGARGCDGAPWNMGTQSLWEDLDARLGAQFAAQTNIRRRAFIREFGDDANYQMDLWNGRIVMHFRHFPLSAVYCAEIKDMLEQAQKRGWGVIRSGAAKARDAVKMDYRPCE